MSHHLHAHRFLIAGFLAVGAFGFVCGSAWRRQAGPPATVAAALARLEERGVRLQVVTIERHGAPQGGVYLCEQARPREELQRLRRATDATGWEGIVQLACAPVSDSTFLDQLDEWGDRAALVGPLVLFGDPDVVRRVAEALRDEARPALPAWLGLLPGNPAEKKEPAAIPSMPPAHEVLFFSPKSRTPES